MDQLGNKTLGNKFKNIGYKTANTTKNTIGKGWTQTKNVAGKSLNQVKSASVGAKIIMGIFFIFVIILIIYLIIWALDKAKKTSSSSPFLITTPVNAYDSKLADKPIRVPEPEQGLDFSYSFWIYIADWNYKFGKYKNIFIKGNPKTGERAPGLWLYPKTNSLHARINTYADMNEGCDIKNIPLRKWVHIAYVLNNRTVDIYIDGKLERTCVLRGVPVLNKKPVYLLQEGGFFGQIAKMQYFTRSLTPTDVSNIYSNGPMMSSNLFTTENTTNKSEE